MTANLWRGILDLASDRRVADRGVGKVPTNSLHPYQCPCPETWRPIGYEQEFLPSSFWFIKEAMRSERRPWAHFHNDPTLPNSPAALVERFKSPPEVRLTIQLNPYQRPFSLNREYFQADV